MNDLKRDDWDLDLIGGTNSAPRYPLRATVTAQGKPEMLGICHARLSDILPGYHVSSTLENGDQRLVVDVELSDLHLHQRLLHAVLQMQDLEGIDCSLDVTTRVS